MGLLRKIGTTLEMIKWEHSIFVLPFAMIGAMLAAGGWPPAVKLFWIVVCMVSGAFGGDGLQSLGRCRHRRGESSHGNVALFLRDCLAGRFVGGFTVAMAAIFVLAASRLNRTSRCCSRRLRWRLCLPTPIRSASLVGRTCFLDWRWALRLQRRGSPCVGRSTLEFCY